MNELTERSTIGQPILTGGTDPTVEELRDRTGEMGYVLVSQIYPDAKRHRTGLLPGPRRERYQQG
jgi:hypothetical protein